MKVEVTKKTEYKVGNELKTNYQVSINSLHFWISDFSISFNNEYFKLVKTEERILLGFRVESKLCIELKKPLDEHYVFLTKKSKNGQYRELVKKYDPNNFEDSIFSKKDLTAGQKISDAKNFKQDSITNKTSKKKIANKQSKSPTSNTDSDWNEKTKFFKEIISYSQRKNVNTSTNSKLFDLISQEMGNMAMSKDDVIQLIEERIQQPQNKIDKKKKKDSPLPTYRDPSILSKFLLEYNQNFWLKYTCHEIDDVDVIDKIKFETKSNNYNFELHLSKIINEFQRLRNEYDGKIDYRIINLILVYLTGESHNKNYYEWSQYDKIKLNWNSNELKDWSKANPDMIPNPGENIINKTKSEGFTFRAIALSINDSIIDNFSSLNIHFKHLFHIRRDNSLLDIIQRKNNAEKYDAHFSFPRFIENIELFTYVEQLIKIYTHIIEMILEAQKKSNSESKAEIEISFYREENKTILEIHHLHSIFGKTADDLINRDGERMLNLITALNGYCNLYIAADFGHNESYVVNIWNNKERKKQKQKVEGVKYRLDFEYDIFN